MIITLLCDMQNHMTNERLILIFRIRSNVIVIFFNVLDYIDLFYLVRKWRTSISLHRIKLIHEIYM